MNVSLTDLKLNFQFIKIMMQNYTTTWCLNKAVASLRRLQFTHLHERLKCRKEKRK